MSSIIYMDHVLYKAAGAGDIGRFENDQTCLDGLLTPDESTILHVYLRNQRREPKRTDFVDIILGSYSRNQRREPNPFGFVHKTFRTYSRNQRREPTDFVDKIRRYSRNQRREPKSTDFVDRILERCPPLLLQANKKGETPLHLAAKYGHSNVVKVLIGRAKALPADPESGVTAAKMMLRMTNGEGETALHEAARNAWGHVVEILTKEDPDFSYSANVHGETPLYIAASFGYRQHGKVIDEIIRNCIAVDYGGPKGRTALHAAITTDDYVTARKILKKETTLTKTTDENGWSPLHYAAYFYDISAVKLLLECDESAAYIAETTEKKRTALHIAAIQGHVDVMKEIVSRCPACCELVDNRGWNALHYAVASQYSDTFEECLRIPELDRLKTEKDDKGNTPFHLIVALTHKQKEWIGVYSREKLSGIYGLNKQELSIANIYSGDFGEIQKEILESLEDVGSGPIGYGPFLYRRDKNEEKNKEEALDKARESHLVVAALIATVTFAAAFTLPGGYKTDKGTAVLAKKAAFIVFVISDAISMVLSITAVFIHFLLAILPGLPRQTSGKLFQCATSYTINAICTMIIAFITGIYAVLHPVLGLAVSICLIGLSFIFLACLVDRILVKQI